MGKIYLKTDYDKCDYITAGKLYEATVAQTVKEHGVKYDAYYITADNGMDIYVHIDGETPHLNNKGHFYLHKPLSEGVKQVRPAMTPEARDILNGIHETVGAETRSDSIVEFMNKHTDMEVELCAVKVQLLKLEEQSKLRIKHLETRASATECSRDFCKSECKAAIEEQSKRKNWMIYSAIVAAYAIGVSVYCLIGG